MRDKAQSGEVGGLLPCPFCGGEAAYAAVRYSAGTVKEQHWPQSEFHFVNCIVCGADTQGLRGAVDQAEARDKWNRRTHESVVPLYADSARRLHPFYDIDRIIDELPDSSVQSEPTLMKALDK